MLKTKLLVFDLDGTLIDSKKDICHAVNLTLLKFGEQALPEEEIEQYVGTGVQPLLQKIFLRQGQAVIDQAQESFRVHYSENLVTHTCLFERMQEVLEHYSKVPKAILTNKSNAFMEPILTKLELSKYFKKAYGRTSFPTQKPDAGPLLGIAKEFSVNPGEIIMIGDTDVDIRAGRNAGTLTCAVLFGYGFKNKSDALEWAPDFIASVPEELIGLF